MLLRVKHGNLTIKDGFDKSSLYKKERDCRVAMLLAMTICGFDKSNPYKNGGNHHEETI